MIKLRIKSCKIFLGNKYFTCKFNSNNIITSSTSLILSKITLEQYMVKLVNKLYWVW